MVDFSSPTLPRKAGRMPQNPKWKDEKRKFFNAFLRLWKDGRRLRTPIYIRVPNDTCERVSDFPSILPFLPKEERIMEGIYLYLLGFSHFLQNLQNLPIPENRPFRAFLRGRMIFVRAVGD
ncbi:hypothetical protein [Blastomonas sp. SL216]|uniref:hypothetical protein n=1 Tax=Blastomonas sp. SL216 TaxID=2995169 RepID=UPI0023774125|nr:hypothetical protein OU999_05485 [Blastomonas sp. SL216]